MTSSPPNPDDPNTWTIGQVRDYRAQHGQNPPGLREINKTNFIPKIDFGLDKIHNQLRDSLGPNIDDIKTNTFGPHTPEVNMPAIQEESDKQLEAIREAQAEREVEHQADRTLIREQTELARQQASETKESNKRAATALFVAWASLGVAVISVVVSIALAIFT